MDPLFTPEEEKQLDAAVEGRFVKFLENVPRGGLQIARHTYRDKLEHEKYADAQGKVREFRFLDVPSLMLKTFTANSPGFADALREAEVHIGDTIEVLKKKDGKRVVWKIKVTEKTTEEKQKTFIQFVTEKEKEEEAQRIAAAVGGTAEPFPS